MGTLSREVLGEVMTHYDNVYKFDQGQRRGYTYNIDVHVHACIRETGLLSPDETIVIKFTTSYLYYVSPGSIFKLYAS